MLSEYKFAVDYQSVMVEAKREGRAEVVLMMLANNMGVDVNFEFLLLCANSGSQKAPPASTHRHQRV